ncbi:MAG TPA: DUF4065 domain-containing protein [Bacillota bacterium]|nr:DUF4065 domain-containing protein [Bacillota bacterium]
MKTINVENKLCLSCMETHDVELVEVIEKNIFKNEAVEYAAVYEFCKNTDECSEPEELIKKNDLSFKDAYRTKMNLLTSDQIVSIRNKYGASQKDFSGILGWGKATIIRYETHQVQDEAHDEILRKIDEDPKWFIELLNKNAGSIPQKAYKKYLKNAETLYSMKGNDYLIEAIKTRYLRLMANEELTGGVDLNLDKVVELINYLAGKIDFLYKVKLMKMLWYSDFLYYKRYGNSITGLAYNALPMGAVPEGYEHIVLLKGVSYDTVFYEDNIGYRFTPTPGIQLGNLSVNEINTIDEVIAETGQMKTNDLINMMHHEQAYIKTPPNAKISYKYAKELSMD